MYHRDNKVSYIKQPPGLIKYWVITPGVGCIYFFVLIVLIR